MINNIYIEGRSDDEYRGKEGALRDLTLKINEMFPDSEKIINISIVSFRGIVDVDMLPPMRAIVGAVVTYKSDI